VGDDGLMIAPFHRATQAASLPVFMALKSWLLIVLGFLATVSKYSANARHTFPTWHRITLNSSQRRSSRGSVRNCKRNRIYALDDTIPIIIIAHWPDVCIHVPYIHTPTAAPARNTAAADLER
jgi:hypothetical protein